MKRLRSKLLTAAALTCHVERAALRRCPRNRLPRAAQRVAGDPRLGDVHAAEVRTDIGAHEEDAAACAYDACGLMRLRTDDREPIDRRAIAAAKVAHEEATVLAGDAGVATRNQRVGQEP